MANDAARWLAEIDALMVQTSRIKVTYTPNNCRSYSDTEDVLTPERVRAMVTACKLLQRWRDTYGGSRDSAALKPILDALDAETDAALNNTGAKE